MPPDAHLAFGGGPFLLWFIADASSIPTAFGVAAAVAATGAAGTLACALRGEPLTSFR